MVKIAEQKTEHEFESDQHEELLEDEYIEYEDEDSNTPIWKQYAPYVAIAFAALVVILIIFKLLGGSDETKVEESSLLVPDSTSIVQESESSIEISMEESSVEEEVKQPEIKHEVPKDKLKPSETNELFNTAVSLTGATEASDDVRRLVFNGFTEQWLEIERGLKEGGDVALKFESRPEVDRLASLIKDGYKVKGETFLVYEGKATDETNFVMILEKDKEEVAVVGSYNQTSDTYRVHAIVAEEDM